MDMEEPQRGDQAIELLHPTVESGSYSRKFGLALLARAHLPPSTKLTTPGRMRHTRRTNWKNHRAPIFRKPALRVNWRRVGNVKVVAHGARPSAGSRITARARMAPPFVLEKCDPEK
jgi:hypothetical protein